MRADFYWISQPTVGRLAILARPRGGDWLADEVAGWRRAGVDVAVSLLTPEEDSEFELGDERRLCQEHGIRFESLPMTDRGVPESWDAVAELAARLAAELADGKTVAIHCRQGIGRAGLLATCVLVTLGQSENEAVRRVESARGRPIPETTEQRRWIADFAAHAPQPTR